MDSIRKEILRYRVITGVLGISILVDPNLVSVSFLRNFCRGAVLS